MMPKEIMMQDRETIIRMSFVRLRQMLKIWSENAPQCKWIMTPIMLQKPTKEILKAEKQDDFQLPSQSSGVGPTGHVFNY